jgi:hypothetical protein
VTPIVGKNLGFSLLRPAWLEIADEIIRKLVKSQHTGRPWLSEILKIKPHENAGTTTLIPRFNERNVAALEKRKDLPLWRY